MQYDFNVAANQSQVLDVKGRFFKYKSGTGMIRVRATSGGYVDLLPGQGVWNTEFSSLTVTDRTGLQNAGVLLAGDFDFHDDRITGTVDVVDGGRTRTLAGTAFAGAFATTPTAGQYTVIGLWNPPGSGKNAYIEQIIVSANVAGEFGIVVNNAQVVNNVGGPGNPNAKRAGAAASVCQYTRASQAAGGTPGQLLLDSYSIANQAFPFRFIEPIMLPPGYGLGLSHAVANASVILMTEHFEENA